MRSNLMLTFGSGGHSTEMLLLIENCRLMEKKVRPLCVVTDDDQLIGDKLELRFRSKEYDLIRLKRARQVGQSYLTSIVTVLLSLFQALHIVYNERPRALITNGPAISVIMCFAIRFLQYSTFTLMYNCDIIYVESFCRTRTLSLSGKIIYLMRLADQFYVQWPKLHEKYPRTSYKGLLV